MAHISRMEQGKNGIIIKWVVNWNFQNMLRCAKEIGIGMSIFGFCTFLVIVSFPRNKQFTKHYLFNNSLLMCNVVFLSLQV